MMRTWVASFFVFLMIFAIVPADDAQAKHRSVPNVTTGEDSSAATMRLYTDCPPRGTYHTEDGSAKAGEDYVAQSGQLVVRDDPSQSRREGTRVVSTFEIPLLDDANPEPSETVRVIVTVSPDNYMFGAGTAGCGTKNYNEVEIIEAVLTIADDDSSAPRSVAGSSGPSVAKDVGQATRQGRRTQSSATAAEDSGSPSGTAPLIDTPVEQGEVQESSPAVGTRPIREVTPNRASGLAAAAALCVLLLTAAGLWVRRRPTGGMR